MGNFAYARSLTFEYLRLHAGEWRKQSREKLAESIIAWVKETHEDAGIDSGELQKLLEILATWLPIILKIFGK